MAKSMLMWQEMTWKSVFHAKGRLASYASRSLTDTEKRYATTQIAVSGRYSRALLPKHVGQASHGLH